ncbi:MAG: helix-turn-helix domain-containing protein [Flavobacteriaceae bacterium]|nr:helix-turn-helix domain-containing protein [Flavobacteriaceae bacterium]
MNNVDIRILRLMDVLIFQKKIINQRQFCNDISILEQTMTKIKNGTSHFTIVHIESICKIYRVNPNWIFSYDDKVFRTKDSIELTNL